MKVTTKNLQTAFPELSRIDALKIMRKITHARTHMSGDIIDATLWIISGYIGGSGVEAIRYANDWVDHYWQEIGLLYINTGDTYNTTIIYQVKRNSFSICCLGDILENSICYL